MNTELYNMYRQLKISDSVLNYCSKRGSFKRTL